MANVVICETRKGNGKIKKEVKPGVLKELDCPAKCNNGKVNKKLI